MKVKREEARNLIYKAGTVKVTETVVLEEAYGRVLADDVFSPVDVPDEDKSAIDGFAFSHRSVKRVPARLRIVGETAAGSERLEVKDGEAVFVMTGGVLPKGADAAVRIEDVKVNEGSVYIDFPVEKGNLVNFKGSEISRGDLLIRKGTKLNERLVGLLAYVGIYRIKVFSVPEVGVFVTGNEVLEPYEPFKKGHVRNSNYYLLKGILSSFGANVHYLGRLKDDPDLMKGKIESALRSFDIVVTTGGVSKGKYDFVNDVVKGIGVDVKITSTNVRPGRPMIFGTYGTTLFFGLPGYPSAMLVNLVEFLLPALRRISGMSDFMNRYVDVFAGESFRSRKGRVDFVRVNLKFEKGHVVAESSGSQQTSNYLTSALCDGFVIIPEELERVEKGNIVKFLPFDWRLNG